MVCTNGSAAAAERRPAGSRGPCLLGLLQRQPVRASRGARSRRSGCHRRGPCTQTISPCISSPCPRRSCGGAWATRISFATWRTSPRRPLWRRTCCDPTTCGSCGAHGSWSDAVSVESSACVEKAGSQLPGRPWFTVLRPYSSSDSLSTNAWPRSPARTSVRVVLSSAVRLPKAVSVLMSTCWTSGWAQGQTFRCLRR